MKHLTLSLFIISFFANAAKGQWHSNFELGANLGFVANTYLYEGFGLDLSYQLPYVKVKVGHFAIINRHGKDEYRYARNGDGVMSFAGFVYPWHTGINKFSYSHLSLQSDFKLGDARIHLGGGLVQQNVAAYHQSVYRNSEIIVVRHEASKKMGYEMRNGFTYKFFEVYFINQWPWKNYMLGFTYRRGLNKKNKALVPLIKKKFEKHLPVVSVFSRLRAEMPFSKKFIAAAVKLELVMNIKLNDEYYLYGTYSFNESVLGADDLKPSYVLEPFITSYTAVNSGKIGRIKDIKVGISRTRYKNDITNLNYGLGISNHLYKGPKWSWDGEGEVTDEINRNVIGINLHGELQHGIFKVGTELTVPLWGIPPTLSFYWAVGISFRKKGKRLKRAKRKNVYENIPGWNN